jgi:hypothetical protein
VSAARRVGTAKLAIASMGHRLGKMTATVSSVHYNHFHYFPQPVWLNDDPLKDGHYANNWDETLWLVEFYAKHHPEHPDHENREYLEIAPHC